ncbi:MAG: stage 0 sporulation protein [Nitrospira sp.]|nr:MAG: stage 0 sporulation protein [Nitrospira sp.]
MDKMTPMSEPNTAGGSVAPPPVQPSVVFTADVKIRNFGEPKKMNAGGLSLRRGDRVMIEVNRDLTYGVLVSDPVSMLFVPPMRMMKTILRAATEQDLATIAQYDRLASEARRYCVERAQVLRHDMKLVEVYASFQRRVLTFVYTAEERIDFREIVRDLARQFGGRIEMLHINKRDEARRLGGVDTCGLPLCCASFLVEIEPVSIKKAKSMGIRIEDNQLGICGKLKCCLLFEVSEPRTAAAPRLIMPAGRS